MLSLVTTYKKYLETLWLTSLILFFWLIGDEEILLHGNFSVFDVYNLIFTILIVTTAWVYFKWIVRKLRKKFSKLNPLIYYIIQVSITLITLAIYIFISNWIYIYIFFQESFSDNYFLELIFPLAIFMTLVWNGVEFTYSLILRLLKTQEALSKSQEEIIQQKQDNSKKNNFVISVLGQHKNIIHLDKIKFIKIEESLVYVITIDNQKYPLDNSLNELENNLPIEHFFRLNRQVIISKNAIEEISPDLNDKLKVKFSNEHQKQVIEIVSRYKAPKLRKWLKS